MSLLSHQGQVLNRNWFDVLQDEDISLTHSDRTIEQKAVNFWESQSLQTWFTEASSLLDLSARQFRAEDQMDLVQGYRVLLDELDLQQEMVDLEMEAVAAIPQASERIRRKRRRQRNRIVGEFVGLAGRFERAQQLQQSVIRRIEAFNADLPLVFREGPAVLTQLGLLMDQCNRRLSGMDQVMRLRSRIAREHVDSSRQKISDTTADPLLYRKLTLHALDRHPFVQIAHGDLTAIHLDRPCEKPRWGSVRSSEPICVFPAFAPPLVNKALTDARRLASSPSASASELLCSLGKALAAVFPDMNSDFDEDDLVENSVTSHAFSSPSRRGGGVGLSIQRQSSVSSSSASTVPSIRRQVSSHNASGIPPTLLSTNPQQTFDFNLSASNSTQHSAQQQSAREQSVRKLIDAAQASAKEQALAGIFLGVSGPLPIGTQLMFHSKKFAQLSQVQNRIQSIGLPIKLSVNPDDPTALRISAESLLDILDVHAHTVGRFYFEFHPHSSRHWVLGLSSDAISLSGFPGSGSSPFSFGFADDGSVWWCGQHVKYCPPLADCAVIGVLIDFHSGNISLYRDGKFCNAAFGKGSVAFKSLIAGQQARHLQSERCREMFVVVSIRGLELTKSEHAAISHQEIISPTSATEQTPFPIYSHISRDSSNGPSSSNSISNSSTASRRSSVVSLSDSQSSASAHQSVHGPSAVFAAAAHAFTGGLMAKDSFAVHRRGKERPQPQVSVNFGAFPFISSPIGAVAFDRYLQFAPDAGFSPLETPLQQFSAQSLVRPIELFQQRPVFGGNQLSLLKTIDDKYRLSNASNKDDASSFVSAKDRLAFILGSSETLPFHSHHNLAASFATLTPDGSSSAQLPDSTRKRVASVLLDQAADFESASTLETAFAHTYSAFSHLRRDAGMRAPAQPASDALLMDTSRSWSSFPPMSYQKNWAASIIARAWRAFKERRQVSKTLRKRNKAAVVIQRFMRKWFNSRQKRKLAAVTSIQRFVRGWIARRIFRVAKVLRINPLTLFDAVVTIQRAFRKWYFFRKARYTLRRIKLFRASFHRVVVRVQRMWRRILMNRPGYFEHFLVTSAVQIQRWWRGVCARRQLMNHNATLAFRLDFIGKAIQRVADRLRNQWEIEVAIRAAHRMRKLQNQAIDAYRCQIRLERELQRMQLSVSQGGTTSDPSTIPSPMSADSMSNPFGLANRYVNSLSLSSQQTGGVRSHQRTLRFNNTLNFAENVLNDDDFVDSSSLPGLELSVDDETSTRVLESEEKRFVMPGIAAHSQRRQSQAAALLFSNSGILLSHQSQLQHLQHSHEQQSQVVQPHPPASSLGQSFDRRHTKRATLISTSAAGGVNDSDMSDTLSKALNALVLKTSPGTITPSASSAHVSQHQMNNSLTSIAEQDEND